MVAPPPESSGRPLNASFSSQLPDRYLGSSAESLLRALLLLLFLGSSALAQAPEGWTRLHVGDGLSHNSVYAIHQDLEGFLWFGTLDGLDRYDGYTFVSHRHDPADPT